MFMCRLYDIDRYTHTELAALDQEGLDLLAAAKMECGREYYDVHFPRIEMLATIMRDWHANEVFRGVLGWLPKTEGVLRWIRK